MRPYAQLLTRVRGLNRAVMGWWLLRTNISASPCSGSARSIAPRQDVRFGHLVPWHGSAIRAGVARAPAWTQRPPNLGQVILALESLCSRQNLSFLYFFLENILWTRHSWMYLQGMSFAILVICLSVIITIWSCGSYVYISPQVMGS
jgi:hypothetical protein